MSLKLVWKIVHFKDCVPDSVILRYKLCQSKIPYLLRRSTSISQNYPMRYSLPIFFAYILLSNFNIVLLNDQIFAGPEVAVKSGNVNLGSITLNTTINSFDT